MRVQQIAEKIKSWGMNVISIKAGNKNTDGEVKISENITIQIGREIGVVRQTKDGKFIFYPPINNWPSLASSIAKARREE